MAENKKSDARLYYGYLLMVAATFGFAIMGVSAKMGSGLVPTFPLVFWRSFVCLMVMLVYMGLRGQRFTFNKGWLLILRGVLGAVSLICYFRALYYITASEASMLISTGPIWTNIIAVIYLKEKFTRLQALSLLVAMVGILLITRPAFYQFNLGYILALVTGFLVGSVHVLLRKLNQTDSPFSMVLSMVLFSMIFSAEEVAGDIFQFTFPDYFTLFSILILLITGISSASAQIHISLAYKYIPASKGSIISLLITVWIVLLSVLVLGETPTHTTLTGGVMVLLSSALLIKYSPHSHS